ncbi:hypothetical protein NKR23_g2248 [Pleurostoma richardsiae]|uniref:NADH dehydrogenase [ubiquinone] 1 alpha subcomplex subunit n=1 Tax=Pleurostoma richardsiae TaxID=41990 RepID=A0AA38S2X2_9PEZI|nr:hypothetical protein NKR23_g2248 [Pleurostoma richardsiae]
MSSKQISPILRAWYNWKALRLPWRKRFLVGLDLHGNTYWEFRDQRLGPAAADDPAAVRWRRIVKYARATPYADVKVSPQWHQWLRHTRPDPPSLDEQAADVARQEQLKVLAAAADARWAAKESLVQAPGRGQPVEGLPDAPGQPMGHAVPAFDTERERGPTPRDWPREGETEKNAIESADVVEAEPRSRASVSQSQGQQQEAQDPWKRHQPSGPSERWQPKGWDPSRPSRK